MEADITTRADTCSGQPGSRVAASPANVCKFFQLGCCRFGTSCRFVHPVDADANSINRTDPGKATPVAGAPAGAAAGETLSSTSFDPSKWINAPVFVPKSRMSYETFQRDNANAKDDIVIEVLEDDAWTAWLNEVEAEEKEKDEEEENEVEEEEEENEVEEEEEEDEAGEEDDEDEEEDELDDEEEEGDESDGGGARASMSYANIVTLNNNHNGRNDGGLLFGHAGAGESRVCSYYEKFGNCTIKNCLHMHGMKCELCDRYCMHPHDAEQRRKHTAECIKRHELDMEHSFAVQRSRDKTCGICLEVIMEKRPREQRFGILPNCKHIFCLNCIRTWRKANNFENKIKRGCPSCRTSSDFVCPSYVWVECDEEKERMITDYKKACNETDCMYFKKGAAKCPFGNKCFYRHALPSGELIDVGAPSRRRDPSRRLHRLDGTQLQELFAQLLLPRQRFIEELLAGLSDDDDSDLDDLDPFDMETNFVYEGGLRHSSALRHLVGIRQVSVEIGQDVHLLQVGRPAQR